jgi:hypothetical protein
MDADQTSRRATTSLYVTTAPVAVPADWNKRATFTTDE